MYNEKLGLSEYENVLLENVSRMVINQSYIDGNFEFFNSLIFKMWENYYNSSVEPISIIKQAQLLEIFLGTMIKEKPSLDLPEDEIKINH